MSDEEGGTTRGCAPFLSLTQPIEVSELGHVKIRLLFFLQDCLLRDDSKFLVGKVDANKSVDQMASTNHPLFSNGRGPVRSCSSTKVAMRGITAPTNEVCSSQPLPPLYS